MKTVILAGLFSLGFVLSGSGELTTKNVLLMIADDVGTDSLDDFNSHPAASLPPTPRINQLADEGMTFSRFYAYPTCSPTRASILTGRYAFRTGVLQPTMGMTSRLEPNEFTLPEALSSAGVLGDHLASIGKWHLGSGADGPNDIAGWPHFSGSLGGGVNAYTNWPKVVNGTNMPNHSVYATTDNVNDALAWLGQQGTNRWFLWVAFNAAHTPFHKPPNNLHDYDALSGTAGDIGSNPRPYYEAAIQSMDSEIARLLGSIDPTETTIIFMGDNGTPGQVVQRPFRANHAKGSLYEGGVRVPMIVAGAAVDTNLVGTVYDSPIHAVDLYATILDLFGVDARDVVPPELAFDSQSFLPALCNDPYTREPPELVFDSTAGRAIVVGDYKLYVFSDGTQEMYNVTSNLAENMNLLEGALNATEQAAYNSLLALFDTYVNRPNLYQGVLDPVNGFSAKMGWFLHSGLTLWRSTDLSTNGWMAVPGQLEEDDGSATLILRDPLPPNDRAFYTISNP